MSDQGMSVIRKAGELFYVDGSLLQVTAVALAPDGAPQETCGGCYWDENGYNNPSFECDSEERHDTAGHCTAHRRQGLGEVMFTIVPFNRNREEE